MKKKVKVRQEDFYSIFHIIQKIEKAFNRRDWWFVVYFIVILSFLFYPIVFSIIEHNDRFSNEKKKSC